MNWNEVVDRVTPFVIKIETPEGHGTGFVCLYNDDKSLCGIATANHVVQHADIWKQPIRLLHFPSRSMQFLRDEERIIYDDQDNDSAVILFRPENLVLPQSPINLFPTENQLPIGAEVAWLGFPALGANTLCFFSGDVSAREETQHSYLIDGVAINGVSGGPVVYSTPADGVQIVGAISAYRANRASGGTLPGLSVARDVSHFHQIASRVKSLDDARHVQAAQKADSPAIEAYPETPPPEHP
jgi:Trypsin-like peptidase domain